MATAKRPRATKSATKSANAGRAAAAAPKVTTKTVDMQEAIRTRAYELFEERGRGHGNDVEDWLRAEEEVLRRFGVSAA